MLLTLAVTPSIKVLGSELRGRQDPVVGLAERWVGIDGGQLFSLLQKLLETWSETVLVGVGKDEARLSKTYQTGGDRHPVPRQPPLQA